MKIAKLAHSCLLIEEKGLRVLADPGGIYYTLPENELTNIDVVLVTHEHGDHYDQAVLDRILQRNPGAKIFTNKGVGAQLSKAGTPYSLLESGSSVEEKGVTIEAFGSRHAVIVQELATVDNTGYLIAGRLFIPGDAFTIPSKPVEVLALPVAGPWLKLPEAVEYARTVKPKLCFPIHEAVIKEPLATQITRLPEKSIEASGTMFVNIGVDSTIV